MDELASTTVMINVFDTTCTDDTDAIWQFGTIEPGVRGRYRCLNLDGNVCHQATLRVDPAATGDMVNHRKTACHELGHSVGLTHSDDQIVQRMINGQAPNSDYFYRSYWSHHIEHIDGHY